MHRTRQRLPISSKELLELQGSLPPHGSTLWEGKAGNLLVARIPGHDPDLVNDLERIAEWATPSHVLDAEACLLLTAKDIHTLPMAPIRSHMEQRLASDQRQATSIRKQLEPKLGHKLYRAVDDPYRRIRLGVRFPVNRMRDVDSDLLDELAATMGAALEGGLDDVHCVHLVSNTDHVRLAPDDFLADMLPRLQDSERRRMAQQRLLQRQREDASARQSEMDALRRNFGLTTGSAPVRNKDSADLDWQADDPRSAMYQRIDALGGATAEPETDPGYLSRLRQHLDRAGYQLRIQPNVPGHAIDLAAEQAGAHPERILAWVVPVLTRDVAERALAAIRELNVGLGIVVAPEADRDGERALIATRVRHVPPDRIEGLRL